MVYSSGSAVRDDVSGPGTWAFMPARLPGGETVVINAGFVQNTMQDRAQQDRAVARLITNEPVTLTGYIRFPESRRHADAGGKPGKTAVVHARSSGDGARARLGRGRQPVAPFYIDLETPVPASGIPKPGPLTVHLKDNHLQYAITWFGLAAVVAIAFAVWWRAQRRALEVRPAHRSTGMTGLRAAIRNCRT